MIPGASPHDANNYGIIFYHQVIWGMSCYFYVTYLRRLINKSYFSSLIRKVSSADGGQILKRLIYFYSTIVVPRISDKSVLILLLHVMP